jgi:hypothetical protein
MRARWDPLAIAAAAAPLVVVVVYLAVMARQGDGDIAIWFVAALAVAALLAGYAASRDAPRRRATLAVAGVLMLALGVLAIFSIGLLALGGAALALIAATRR